jgi:hypothetical protein
VLTQPTASVADRADDRLGDAIAAHPVKPVHTRRFVVSAPKFQP